MRRYLFVLFYLLVSCGGFDDDNDQADNPVEVIDILLPQTQAALGRAAGGEYALYHAVFMQQLAGIDGMLLEIDRYNIEPVHTDKIWSGFYVNVFSSLSTIIRYSETGGIYKARGMARIMMANALGMVTSAWGDVPFSESFLTEKISLRPAYDKQEELYNRIFSLLDGGIEDMLSHGDQSFPSSQDMYFGGDPERWIRLAGFLTFRYRLHLAGRTGYSQLTDLSGSDMFLEPGEKLEVNFSGFEDFSHPLYEFFLVNPGSAGAGLFIVDEMKAVNDPRLNIYFNVSESGLVEGSAAGEGSGAASMISSLFVSRGAPVILASYTEQKFIEAEVYLKTGRMVEAAEAFNEGLQSSLLDWGLSDEEWFLQNRVTGQLTMDQLIRGRYTALFLQPEIWSDWRRTGYPSLDPAQGNSTDDQIPRRLPYPESEYLLNPENVPDDTGLTTPVWWDTN